MYKPKHRKQRELSVPVGKSLAVGVAAAGLAGAAVAAAPAAEAAGNVWDRVASCESGNNWHINTGNGYYGGVESRVRPGTATTAPSTPRALTWRRGWSRSRSLAACSQRRAPARGQCAGRGRV